MRCIFALCGQAGSSFPHAPNRNDHRNWQLPRLQPLVISSGLQGRLDGQTIDGYKYPELYDKNEIKEILEFGAKLCKDNSKYNFLNDLKILYMPLKKLEKGNKIGEVIISGKKNTISL